MDVKVLASGSTGNCYLVGDGRTRLLLECGIPMKKIQQGCMFQLSGVSGCLVTHEHDDHSHAVKDLVLHGINCYMSSGTADALGVNGFRIRRVASLQPFEIGTFRITPFATQHDCADPLGYLLHSSVTGENLLFATDTYYLRYRFKGLTHIMIECNYIDDLVRDSAPTSVTNRLYSSHMSLDTCIAFLRANDLSTVKTIWLIHLSNSRSNAEQMKAAVERATGKRVVVV
jgi:phosphoribosyl 1,2-cyclic phosphodiesterase